MPYKPAPTIVATQSGLYNVQTAQRKYDVSKSIARYMPDAAPFTVLLKSLNSASVKDTTFKILQEQPQPWADACNGAVTAVATAITVDNGPYFKNQDLVKNERTGEIVKVNAAPSGNSLGTVIRALNHSAN